MTIQIIHYYPYGGTLTHSTEQGFQKYKYNGKEFDRTHGLDWYDYSARQYDPASGRFTSMDPLCEKYYNISPYSYCAGNPIRYVDPDGRKIQVIGSDEYRSWVLSTLQKLTDDKLSMNSKGYISITKNVNGKLSTGTGLLRETISNKHTAYIKKGINSVERRAAVDKSD